MFCRAGPPTPEPLPAGCQHVRTSDRCSGLAEALIWMGNADVAQLVEHNLAKVGVAGSNPVVRSHWPFAGRGQPPEAAPNVPSRGIGTESGPADGAAPGRRERQLGQDPRRGKRNWRPQPGRRPMGGRPRPCGRNVPGSLPRGGTARGQPGAPPCGPSSGHSRAAASLPGLTLGGGVARRACSMMKCACYRPSRP